MVENKKIGDFHVFILVIASLMFIYSLAGLISLTLGQVGIFSYFISSDIFGWIDVITGTIGSIFLFVGEIRHIKNTSWYALFLVGTLIFVLNNVVSLTDTFIQIVQVGSNGVDTYSISMDIFNVGFWIFSAWFAKRGIDS